MRGSRAFFAGGRNIVLARRSSPQKAVGPPAAPHAQPMRVKRTARPPGPISAPAARRGTASPVPRPTTSQSHRGVVVWAKNQHACAKTRGSFVDRVFPVRETNTASQGKRLRRCLFLLFGSTESEAVFVSFVWVNSLKKRRNPLRAFKKKATEDKENIVLLPVASPLSHVVGTSQQ
jgi:hypothetical protein